MKIPIIKKYIGKPKLKTVRKFTLITVITVITALVILSSYLLLSMLNAETVYNGIYLDGINLSGMNNEQLKKYILKTYTKDLNNLEINIFDNQYSVKKSFADLGVSINTENIYNLVYEQGREGNFLKRIKEIFKLNKESLYLEAEISYTQDEIDKIIEEISKKLNLKTEAPRLIIGSDKVTLCSGTYGYTVNSNYLKNRIIDAIYTLKSSIVIIPIDEIAPSKIDVDTVFNKINQDKKNALTIVNDNSVEVIPHINGMFIDKQELAKNIAWIENRESRMYTEVELPVTFDIPEITTSIANEYLFRDILYDYETKFDKPNITEISLDSQNNQLNTYKLNRVTNIELATKAIDGTILAPGEEFSFNEIVGKRTAQKGYKPAFIYYNDSIDTSIGGGICQVSSTLYNAVIKSNLKVTERNAHSIRVDYVPLGRDATVSFGTSDFKFINNSDWPIRINGKVTSEKLYFSISGTNLNPNLQVDLICSPYNKIPYEEEHIVDPQKPAGYKEILQKGMDGVTVDTFFILKNTVTGSILKNYKLYTNTYKMLPAKILIGTETSLE